MSKLVNSSAIKCKSRISIHHNSDLEMAIELIAKTTISFLWETSSICHLIIWHLWSKKTLINEGTLPRNSYLIPRVTTTFWKRTPSLLKELSLHKIMTNLISFLKVTKLWILFFLSSCSIKTENNRLLSILHWVLTTQGWWIWFFNLWQS